MTYNLHGAGISPVTYVLMAGGVLFWAVVVFFAVRKSLLEGRSPRFEQFLHSIRGVHAAAFHVVAVACSILSVFSLLMAVNQVAHFAGVTGPYLAVAGFSGVLAGLSLSAALYLKKDV